MYFKNVEKQTRTGPRNYCGSEYPDTELMKAYNLGNAEY
jgi:hypothetical protein